MSAARSAVQKFFHSLNNERRTWLCAAPRAITLLVLSLLTACTTPRPQAPLERVHVSADGRGFVMQSSGRAFTPWGFNYDHDETGRLLEDYWDAEWPKVEEDFREMKELGANVVRVHLQFGKFMRSETEPNTQALARFTQLLRLAERTRLYLDVTGLGCYHKQDVPAWYDALDEERRWAAQANFWRAVARAGRGSHAVFCYDLMNEPVAPHSNGVGKDWLGPPLGGKHFVQWISREGRGRERHAMARAWIQQLVRAIRAEDSAALVTVGVVDWSLPRPGLDSAYHPAVVAPELDFLSVHLYPERGKVGDSLDTLRAFQVGKPVVIEETFPLKCSAAEFDDFFRRAQPHAAGWMGFYWGRTPDECRRSHELTDAFMLGWLEWFQKQSGEGTEAGQPSPSPEGDGAMGSRSVSRDYARSKRSRFITLFHAAMKSWTNCFSESAQP